MTCAALVRLVLVIVNCLMRWRDPRSLFFFFNDTATTEIYTLSLHDALPIYGGRARRGKQRAEDEIDQQAQHHACLAAHGRGQRSEEHTSELQSHLNLVCRLLLEKKKNDK